MDISLHPEIEKVVRMKVDSGEYPSVEALVEEALFLLVERDWMKSQADLRDRVPGVPGLAPQASSEDEPR